MPDTRDRPYAYAPLYLLKRPLLPLPETHLYLAGQTDNKTPRNITKHPPEGQRISPDTGHDYGKGCRHTEYTMLGTVLLPVIKKTIGYHRAKHTRYRQNDDTYNTSKERLKNTVGLEIFKGISEEDRTFLKNKGLYD